MIQERVLTAYQIIETNGLVGGHARLLPAEPNYEQLEAILDPIFHKQRAKSHWEHVSVLGETGQRLDMFVDEEGVTYNLPENRGATRHYHRNHIKRARASGEPIHVVDGIDTSAPKIYGIAVIFTRRVWF